MSRPATLGPRAALLVALVAAPPSCAPSLPSFEQRRAEDHNRVGSEAFRRGDLDTAAAHYERAIEVARTLGDRVAETDALNNLGVILETRGDDDAALASFDAALLRAAPPGATDDLAGRYLVGVWSASLNRSRLLLRADRTDDAAAALEEARVAAEQLGTRVARAAVLKQKGLLLRATGRPAEALDAALEALRLYEIGVASVEARASRADTHLLIGRLRREGGDHVRAIGAFRAAADFAEDVPDRRLRATALASIGGSLEELGHLDDARLRYRLAYDEFRDARDLTGAEDAARALVRIADTQHRSDHLEEAEALLGALE